MSMTPTGVAKMYLYVQLLARRRCVVVYVIWPVDCSGALAHANVVGLATSQLHSPLTERER